VVTIDFQDMAESTLNKLDSLLYDFCLYLAEELDLEDELDTLWAKQRDPKRMARTFVRRHVLRPGASPLLLAMDEVDRVFQYPRVSSDFFLMLRAWHESAKTQPEFEQLKMAISYSTEAKLAIADLNASPFNVGEEARIVPFTSQQVEDLMHRHGQQWSAQEAQTIMELLGGQPYLVRRALYLLAKGEYDLERLLAKAAHDDGPFSDHLRHHLVNVKQFPDCAEALRAVIERETCKDALLAARLTAAGLVVGSAPRLRPACGLYARYFRDKL